MQQVSKPELQIQPVSQYFVRQLRTVYGAFWTLASTTLALQKTPFSWFNVGLSAWFGVVMGLFAVGLFDSLVPEMKQYLETKNE